MIADLRPKPPRLFSTLPCIDGYDVIDTATGRPVDHRDTHRQANGVAFKLNGAAMISPRALANALGAHDRGATG